MASNIWLRTILIVRKETRCRHIGNSFRLTARVLLYPPSHRQDCTYHGLCYTSRGTLAGTRNSSMGPPHDGSIRRPIAPWVDALTTELHLAPRRGDVYAGNSNSGLLTDIGLRPTSAPVVVRINHWATNASGFYTNKLCQYITGFWRKSEYRKHTTLSSITLCPQEKTSTFCIWDSGNWFMKGFAKHRFVFLSFFLSFFLWFFFFLFFFFFFFFVCLFYENNFHVIQNVVPILQYESNWCWWRCVINVAPW